MKEQMACMAAMLTQKKEVPEFAPVMAVEDRGKNLIRLSVDRKGLAHAPNNSGIVNQLQEGVSKELHGVKEGPESLES
jgi:hypothetical protein